MMVAIRKHPFGYQMVYGEIALQQTEAATTLWAYQTYADGASFRGGRPGGGLGQIRAGPGLHPRRKGRLEGRALPDGGGLEQHHRLHRQAVGLKELQAVLAEHQGLQRPLHGG